MVVEEKKEIDEIKAKLGEEFWVVASKAIAQYTGDRKWEEISKALSEKREPETDEKDYGLLLKQILCDPKFIELFQKEVQKREIENKSKEILPTFAIPSHPLTFTLLAMFAGKPENIPKKLLQKPIHERTAEEQKQVEEFIKSILQKEKGPSSFTPDGKVVQEETVVALICDNPIVEAKARIKGELAKDYDLREESLAHYIRRVFGPEGLRHLLGLLICMEEQGRQKGGYFEWSLNDHLKRLGFTKKKRTYDIREKRTATAIMQILTNLVIWAKRKHSTGKYDIEFERLFTLVKGEMRVDNFTKDVLSGKFLIRGEDYWYRNAIDPKDGKSPQYTKMLDRIAQESHQDHWLTIYMAPLLAVFWRMSPGGQKFKVKTLMDWCDLDYTDHNKFHYLRELIDELDYMLLQGYLGRWEHNGEKKSLLECQDSFECVLTLYPPEWLRVEITAICEKRNELLPEPQIKDKSIITREEFCNIYEKSGLSLQEFAKKLEVSKRMVQYIKSGKRMITHKITKKIKETFGEINISGEPVK